MIDIIQQHFLLFWWLCGAAALVIGMAHDFRHGKSLDYLRMSAETTGPSVTIIMILGMMAVIAFFGPLIMVPSCARLITRGLVGRDEV